ncbi:hypothetical protein Daesc_007465 [Daldinia eschscholtzii]|uniref:DUF676 domain-containing protein n=1 Tax=Daldinia eschscholtzii TaxID=292717 RepID=A0AAX6MEV2_9PEZI
MEYTGGSLKADHLCVLVHGLWGNPNHMKSVAKALRDAYSEDQLYLLVAKRNAGSFTYDGIELGGERVCLEIEEELEKIKKNGGKITKISIVGYSLGGLVARYAVGLLEMRGLFKEVEPVNFVTFATPHLGVRSPLKGWANHVWNVLGARMLCMSGRQLFIIDEFRDTGRPLLEVLADPESIFISGLKRFKRRTLYANVVNDRSAVYYTTCIAKTDPYTDLKRVKANFVKGYEDIILDPLNPVMPVVSQGSGKAMADITTGAQGNLRRTLFLSALVVFLPVGIVALVVNAIIQTFRSSKRIQLHESGLAGIQVKDYRSPIWIKDLRGTVEDIYESLNNLQGESYLRASDDERDSGKLNKAETEIIALERKKSHPQFPTLALAPSQFTMINELDKVGWRKYPVWIHQDMHSHAAIIVRSDTPRFKEGLVVLRHWVSGEFLI